ncbi:MAG: hypothetical protein J1E39_03875 [Eubacterium sp.]|nr:hypothetical protein [Eubacterium sp.]
MRKSILIKLIAAGLAAFTAILSAGCESTDPVQSSDGVFDTVSSEASENESTPADNSDESTAQESSEPEKEHVYVENGRFSLPDNAFSFALAEGWEMTDNGIAYQFANEESVNNTFNLVAAETYTDIGDTTETQMTGTYQSMMTDFEVIDFQHTKIDGMPAVFMNISGKYSMMNTDTVIYQYAIQADNMLYTLSFTQGGWDDGFSDMITELVDSIEVNIVE